MKTNKFLFVNSLGTPGSVEDAELVRSQARSHAALASRNHQKDPLKGPQGVDNGKENLPPDESSPKSSKTDSPKAPNSPDPPVKPMNIKFRLHVAGRKKSPSTAKIASQKPNRIKEKSTSHSELQLPPISLLKPINKSSLDPFVRPAADLSVPDMHLLHLYLTKMPHETYGTTASPIAAKLYEGSMVGVEQFEINLLWCLMSIETTFTSFQTSEAARQSSILTRRSRIYSLMKTKINELKYEKSEDPLEMDNFMLVISMAATIERRMHNYHQADLHTKALKDFLLLKGGITAIKNMLYPQNLMIVNALIEIGLQGLYNSREYLLRRLAAIMERLRQLQEWNQTLRDRKQSRISNAISGGQTWTVQTLPGADYLDRRTQAFHKPALFTYIELPVGKPTAEEYKFYLSMLFAINTALYAFRHSEKTCSTYLKLLIECTESSHPSSSFILQCFGAKLPCLLLLIMLAHYAADSEGRDEFTKAVFDVEDIYEFVELMMMASPDSRDVVLRVMWSWLASPDAQGVGSLSPSKFDLMTDEIEDQWLADHIYPAQGQS